MITMVHEFMIRESNIGCTSKRYDCVVEDFIIRDQGTLPVECHHCGTASMVDDARISWLKAVTRIYVVHVTKLCPSSDCLRKERWYRP
jgi:hypothetical protein